MMRLNVSRNLLLLVPAILLAGCTAAAYQRLEEASLPLYQKGTPMMSTIKVVCRRISKNDMGRFQVSYDHLWDVTHYPTYPDTPPRYELSWCTDGVQVFHQTEQNKNHNYNGSSLDGGNKDPQKGAVNTWQMAVINMDGLNYRNTLIQFGAAVVEGERYPLGTGFAAFGLPYYDVVPYEPDSTFVANGLQWQRKTWREIFLGNGKRADEPTGLMEVYQAKVGNYSVLVYGKFTKPIVEHPDWLEKRRAFLRQWVETFKVEPIKP
jgi:hypothetical protein